MKSQLKISDHIRKKIALTLIVNFFLINVLSAFPQADCDGMCSIDDVTHECSDMNEMSCCNMMDMTHPEAISLFGTEVGENSCGYGYDTLSDFTFIIPKSLDTKIDIAKISITTIDFDKEIKYVISASDFTISDSGPPIYLSTSSFLI